MKKILIPILMLLILTVSVFGSNTYSQTYQNQAGSLAPSRFNVFDYNNISYVGVGSSGNEDFPKICDIDNDNLKEVLINTGSSIEYYSGNGNELALEGSVVFNSGYTIENFVCVQDNAGDNLVLAFLNDGVSYRIGTYLFTNGVMVSKTALLYSSNVSNYAMNTDRKNDVNCAEYEIFYEGVSGHKVFKCVYQPEDSDSLVVVKNYEEADALWLTALIKPTYGGVNMIAGESTFKYNLLTPTLTTSLTNHSAIQMGNFGNRLIFLASTKTNDGLFEINLGDLTCIEDPGETTLICPSTEADSLTRIVSLAINEVHTGLTTIDYDGYSIYCFQTSDGSSTVANCYDSTGIINSISISSGAYGQNVKSSYSMGFDLNGDGYEEYIPTVPVPASTLSSSSFKIRPYDVFNDALMTTTSAFDDDMALAVGLNLEGETVIVSNSVASNTDTFAYYLSDGSLDVNNLNPDSALSGLTGYALFDDISGDGFNELIINSASGLKVVFSQPDTASVITIYGTGYKLPFDENNCIGDNVLIEMRECIDTLDCTYTTDSADLTEKEKICSNCGGTQAYSCGSLSLTNPTFTCTNLTVEGDNTFTIDFYTDVNLDELATQINVTINMISGTDGSTCNILSTIGTYPIIGGTDGDAEDDVADDEEDGWTGDEGESLDVQNPKKLIDNLSAFWRYVFGLAMVIGIVSSVVAKVPNATSGLVVFVGILSLILVTALGFIDVYVVVIGIIASLLFLVISTIMGKS